MDSLSSKERLLRTIQGQPIDRVPTFDILHNLELIEYLGGESLTAANAEDLICRAVSKVLDLVRHFAVPDCLEPRIVRDETGFVYRYEWWTGHVLARPHFASTREIEYSVNKDIDIIYDCIARGRVCHLARQHVRLFDENFETFAEVKSEFERIVEKLEGALMLPPEDESAVAVAVERYDETGWWYFWQDYPATASRYLDALTDYQLAFIDAFGASAQVSFTQISNVIGSMNRLLYSPTFLRREVFPREKKKVDRWKQHGYYVLAFLDGYKWPVIDDFIAMGVDEIHPCEPYCGMDVRAFRQKYPSMAVGQPIDCVHLLPYGSEEEVRGAVNKAIADASGRIIIGSTSEIHPAVKVENALAMYDAARHYPLS